MKWAVAAIAWGLGVGALGPSALAVAGPAASPALPEATPPCGGPGAPGPSASLAAPGPLAAPEAAQHLGAVWRGGALLGHGVGHLAPWVEGSEAWARWHGGASGALSSQWAWPLPNGQQLEYLHAQPGEGSVQRLDWTWTALQSPQEGWASGVSAGAVVEHGHPAWSVRQVMEAEEAHGAWQGLMALGLQQGLDDARSRWMWDWSLFHRLSAQTSVGFEFEAEQEDESTPEWHLMPEVEWRLPAGWALQGGYGLLHRDALWSPEFQLRLGWTPAAAEEKPTHAVQK